ncbi:MAG: transcriptional repressor [Candidatus Fermentibacteraceae bacterium]|nr:transcriptional repressor [Candidatus Fermentibacteraceae bacterium]
MTNTEAYNQLRQTGLRMTGLKREIVDLFLGGACGLSVKGVMAGLHSSPAVSTVYRALSSLNNNGFLRHSVGPEGVVQYRCTKKYFPKHGHFCCVKCGGTIPVNRRLPDAFLALLEEEYGISVDSADFLVEGKCYKCRNL